MVESLTKDAAAISDYKPILKIHTEPQWFNKTHHTTTMKLYFTWLLSWKIILEPITDLQQMILIQDPKA